MTKPRPPFEIVVLGGECFTGEIPVMAEGRADAPAGARSDLAGSPAVGDGAHCDGESLVS